ncbi:MAG: hypothetical protein ACLU38_00770 [Dysosmobacter sp.]
MLPRFLRGVHDADYLRDGVFRLEAEVVEVKEKPTYPQGELGADAFGRKPVYEDRGLRLRAILALGRADVGDMETLRPTMPGVTVIGGSSDHCILDVTDAPQPVQVGDVCPSAVLATYSMPPSGTDVPVVGLSMTRAKPAGTKIHLRRNSPLNNDNFMVFVYNAIIALFAFFVAAPMLLNAISLFTVQKRFAKAMVDEGVVKEETVRRLHPKKQVAGVLISCWCWPVWAGPAHGWIWAISAAASLWWRAC